MLLIVLLHIVGLGGITGGTPLFSVNHQVAWGIYLLANCGVDCFALISGYVGVTAKYKYSNIVLLWLRVVFYTLGITACFQLFMPEKVSLMSWVHAVFPVYYEEYWYFSAYFVLFLFIPVLNLAIDRLSKKQIKVVLILMIMAFSVIPTLLYKLPFNMRGGSTAWWLMVVYLIGGYIRKYDFGKSIKTYKLVLLLFGCWAIMWLSCFVIDHVTMSRYGEVRYEDYLINNISPFVLTVAVCLLILFSRMRVNKTAIKIISVFSPVAFSVYLIHIHPLVRDNILSGFFKAFAGYSAPLLIAAILGAAIAVYAGCTVIDWIRILLFRLIRIKPVLEKAEQKVIGHLWNKKDTLTF